MSLFYRNLKDLLFSDHFRGISAIGLLKPEISKAHPFTLKGKTFSAISIFPLCFIKETKKEGRGFQ